MWSWVCLGLVIYHSVRWPRDIWWMAWVLCWLQISVVFTTLPCYKTHPRGKWILKTIVAMAFVLSLWLWIDIDDLVPVAVITFLTILYGTLSYHNLLELAPKNRRHSFAMRSWPIWNVLHKYYRLEVWWERRHKTLSPNGNIIIADDDDDQDNTECDVDSDNSIDILFRLWMVSCNVDHYYRRWPSKQKITQTTIAPNRATPSLWIAHPHGSGSTSILLAFAFCGTCVDDSTFKPLVIALDDGYFAVPLLREVLLWVGCISAQKEAIKTALLDGYSVVVAPGLYEESLKSTFNVFSVNLNYTQDLLEMCKAFGNQVRPVVVLGENESLSYFHWWDRFRSWIWSKCEVRLPGVTWPFWTPKRYLIVGRALDHTKARDLFTSRWLMLFDESRCALRQIDTYYEHEGSEDDNMSLLRAELNRPLQPRTKKFLHNPVDASEIV